MDPDVYDLKFATFHNLYHNHKKLNTNDNNKPTNSCIQLLSIVVINSNTSIVWFELSLVLSIVESDNMDWMLHTKIEIKRDCIWFCCLQMVTQSSLLSITKVSSSSLLLLLWICRNTTDYVLFDADGEDEEKEITLLRPEKVLYSAWGEREIAHLWSRIVYSASLSIVNTK